jgi:hypothetical protein
MSNHDGTCGDGEYAYLYHFKGHWLISRALYKMPFTLVSAPSKAVQRSPEQGLRWLFVRGLKRRGQSKYQRAPHIHAYCTKQEMNTDVVTAMGAEACKAVEVRGE